ncbi:hypothetical protein JM47_02900 [Ureaplasma diversum]|uniref:Uncharacterized protein n=1 Tax=Ureaplasma diversum TaxID=42094 RepID=A0A0C5RM60_9BACT|nr:hypothetical protein [Ureaplasma diversum]AJQ45497.1 hypothetical protein JM47_02900 [Ureaplasma diversum]
MLTQQEFALNKLSDLTIEKLNDKQKLKEIAQKYNEHFRTVVKKYKNIEMLANKSTTVAYLVTFFSQYKQFVNLIHQLVSQLPEKLTEIEAKLDDVLSSAKKEYTDEWDKDDSFKKINEDLVKIFYDVLKQTKQNQA